MDVDMLRVRLGTAQSWEKRCDAWWLEDQNLDVESMARLMIELQARLATITAIPVSQEECRVAYHWDLDGQLLTLATTTHEGSVPSIAAICPAAEWIEREIHDYFDVHLMGREDLPPLVLRRQRLPHPAAPALRQPMPPRRPAVS